MASFYKAPTSNYWSTTLNGAINDSVTTITLTSTTGLQSPGVLVINREDGSGTATPSAREIIHYTGVSGNDITGVTRGEENGTARAHSDGALVEAVFTVEMWNDTVTAVDAALSTDGTDLAITGTASIAALNINTFLTHPRLAITSVASIARAEIPVLENIQISTSSLASVGHIAYKASKPATTSNSDGATITFDMNESNTHSVTLGGNRTLAFTNTADGQAFMIRLKQDGTGSRTVTWTPGGSATILWAGGVAPTLTTTAGKVDTFGFFRSAASL